MKAEDLMLGNYFNFNNGEDINEVLQISSIHCDDTIRFKHKDTSIGCFSTRNKMIKPIPLDEEQLGKLGFELKYKVNYKCYHLEGWLPYLVNRGEKIYQVMQVADCIIEYVHDLQNLYKALTGKPLTYKEHEK